MPILTDLILLVLWPPSHMILVVDRPMLSWIGMWFSIKDRQQEAEHDLRYLTLFSGYCKHIDILYMK